MKRLLIVDDEHHIVNWLADLFESQNEHPSTFPWSFGKRWVLHQGNSGAGNK